MKTPSWRPIVVIIVIFIAVVCLLPTIHMVVHNKLADNKEDKIEEPTWWPKRQINLGLDLQGGMHLVLEVDTDEAVKNAVGRTNQELSDFVRKKDIRVKTKRQTNNTTILIKLRDDADQTKAKELIAKGYGDYDVKVVQVNGSQGIKMSLKESQITQVKNLAAEKALMKIRNRVDETGVREPDIRPQGEKGIIVQLPGVKDAEKARSDLGRTGNLEFKLVDHLGDINKALKGDVPAGSRLYHYSKENKRMAGQPVLLKKQALLTGEELVEARVGFDPRKGTPVVNIKFNPKGTKTFAKITGENIDKQLAIVVDGKVYSAPYINDKIVGKGVISGDFTDETAKSLALVLREAFPTKVRVLFEETVGASLGEDSIRKGLTAMLIGGVLVIFFMIVYYRGSGFIANIALLVNIILIGGALAGFGATLTLPGIAGIILTIGMAVDANVLIFERIKEELRLGKTPLAAVDSGYSRASLTILDANVTTLIAALVLFQFGSGPVKGFAVTLSIGVVSSLFTALILTRSIFDFFLVNRRVKSLSI